MQEDNSKIASVSQSDEAVGYTTKIQYDDNFFDIIDKINTLLEYKNIEIVLDGKEHDGFEVIGIKEVV